MKHTYIIMLRFVKTFNFKYSNGKKYECQVNLLFLLKFKHYTYDYMCTLRTHKITNITIFVPLGLFYAIIYLFIYTYFYATSTKYQPTHKLLNKKTSLTPKH